jgi:peptidylprolyl isomerase domain and WD repeat-containing protein 1
LIGGTDYPTCSHRDKGERDVFNEKPTRDEQTVAAAEPVKGAGSSGTQAVIHTTKGDIVSEVVPSSLEDSLTNLGDLQTIKLFPEHAPKAVENFVRLAQEGFYNGIIFHRVIQKFVSGIKVP